MKLAEIYSELVGRSDAGVAVFGRYPGSENAMDNATRIRTVVDARIQGAWRTEFKKVSDKVFFASIFADEETADKFKTVLKENKNVRVLRNF